MIKRFSQVRVVDAQSPYNGQTVDIVVSDGIIQSISVSEPVAKGDCVSPGWVDMAATTGEPGFEERETLRSLAAAAAFGGFVQVAVSPAGYPVRDNRPTVDAFLKNARGLPIELLPLGAVSMGLEGEALAELYSMHEAGAVGFFDDNKSMERAQLLKIALQYTDRLDVVVYSTPLDTSIAPLGMVHEGIISTQLGLKSIPSIAEELRIQRDLTILSYTGGRLHFHALSTMRGVQMIAEAKAQGLSVTADTTIAHLIGSDDDLKGFDTAYKTWPPLRSNFDREALWAGVKEGTIDAISSGHRPYDVENKQVEFDNAAFGAATLDFAYAWFTARYGSDPLTQETWVRAVTQGPRSILHLGNVRIQEGMPAEFTFFNPSGATPEKGFSLGMNIPKWPKKGSIQGIHTGFTS